MNLTDRQVDRNTTANNALALRHAVKMVWHQYQLRESFHARARL